MPTFRDHAGNFYDIPDDELKRYKVEGELPEGAKLSGGEIPSAAYNYAHPGAAAYNYAHPGAAAYNYAQQGAAAYNYAQQGAAAYNYAPEAAYNYAHPGSGRAYNYVPHGGQAYNYVPPGGPVYNYAPGAAAAHASGALYNYVAAHNYPAARPDVKEGGGESSGG